MGFALQSGVRICFSTVVEFWSLGYFSISISGDSFVWNVVFIRFSPGCLLFLRFYYFVIWYCYFNAGNMILPIFVFSHIISEFIDSRIIAPCDIPDVQVNAEAWDRWTTGNNSQNQKIIIKQKRARLAPSPVCQEDVYTQTRKKQQKKKITRPGRVVLGA